MNDRDRPFSRLLPERRISTGSCKDDVWAGDCQGAYSWRHGADEEKECSSPRDGEAKKDDRTRDLA